MAVFFAIGICRTIEAPSSARAALPAQTLFALLRGGVGEFDTSTGKSIGFIRASSLSVVASGPFRHVWVGSYYADPLSFYVYEFVPWQRKPIRTIATVQGAGNIAVSTQGELAVAGNSSGEGGDRLLFYRYGSTTPTRTVNPGLKVLEYVAFDQRGNCWVDGLVRPDPQKPHTFVPYFGYVAPNSTKIIEVPFEGSPQDGRLTIDASGNIVVVTNGGIEAFNRAGVLVSQTPLQAMPTAITGIALSADGSTLFVSSFDTRLTTYAYPAGGPPTHVFGGYSGGLAIGGE